MNLTGLLLGMTKADVRALLGAPDTWSCTTRKYREPFIWKYGNVELTFNCRKHRTPYPGPPLLRIKTT